MSFFYLLLTYCIFLAFLSLHNVGFLLNMYGQYFLTSFRSIIWHILILLYCMYYVTCMHTLVAALYLVLSFSLLFYFLYDFILPSNSFAKISFSDVLEFLKIFLISCFSDDEKLGFIFDLPIFSSGLLV